MTLVIRLDAGHDRNGNPRRVFVALDKHGDIIGACDEGYVSDAEARKRWPKAVFGPTFATTPAEYRELVKRERDTNKMMGAKKR